MMPDQAQADSGGTSDQDLARDLLANERTFLAWTRTGISTMAFGVVIAKLRYLFARPDIGPPTPGIERLSTIGEIFAAVGLLTVFLAARRYATVRSEIRSKSYRDRAWPVLLFAGVVAVLGVFILWYLVTSVRSR